MTWKDLNTFLHGVYGYKVIDRDANPIEMRIHMESISQWMKVPINTDNACLAELWLDKLKAFLDTNQAPKISLPIIQQQQGVPAANEEQENHHEVVQGYEDTIQGLMKLLIFRVKQIVCISC